MKTQKNEQKKRILARLMAQELSQEQLKKVSGQSGTCTMSNDADAQQV